MIIPDTNLRHLRRPIGLRRQRRGNFAIAGILLGAILVAAIGWMTWVYSQIQSYATHDESQPADAIAVFGAAEYDGRPSPVLRARLDHGLQLYEEKLAPMIITLGGGDPTDLHSEGAVGHDYLMAHGVPEKSIIAETESRNTEESARRLAVIARTNGFKKLVVVSDGTHLFRIHELCSSLGLNVATSPRIVGKSLPAKTEFKRIAHEMASYMFWRVRRAAGMDRPSNSADDASGKS